MKARLIVVSAPSGAGKSSFVERIVREVPHLVDTITYTTRNARPGESEGHPYHFVSPEKFADLRDQQFFVEWAVVHGNLYGTPRHQIDDAWDAGHAVIMDIDVQGARSLRRVYPEDVATVFILPPSLEELRRRVTRRDGQAMRDLDVRMAAAEQEIAASREFDYCIVNDDFDKSYAAFKKLVVDLTSS